MCRKPIYKYLLFGILIMGLFSFFSCKNFFGDNSGSADRVTKTLSFDLSCMINAETGFYEKNHPEYMADFHFYPVQKGDRIIFDAKGYEYTFAFYTDEIEERFIHTYCYQEEESWTKYSGNLQKESWRTTDYIFKQSGWCRICVKKKNNAVLSEQEIGAVSAKISLLCQKQKYIPKDYFKAEIEKTAETVNALRDTDSLVFGLMTDSHFVINGGWEDTLYNLQQVNKKAPFDGFIHLGDFTDGMTPVSITKEYFNNIYADLKTLNTPLYLVLGNHDANYFRNNPGAMSSQEQGEFYLKKDKPYYYQDFEAQKLRLIVLYSFDHTQKTQETRYGFPTEEVEWVQQVLDKTPVDYKVLICSHVPLLAKMHYWSKEIRNSDAMIAAFNSFITRGGTILGFIHGHNHAEQVNKELAFPIISIGCTKCEDFKDRKPEGSYTYDRQMKTVNQDLWDVLVVKSKENKFEFVRFGAGEDRTVE